MCGAQIATTRVIYRPQDLGTPVREMDEKKSDSCWGLTTKAVLGIAGLMLLTWLIGDGVETGAVLAAG